MARFLDRYNRLTKETPEAAEVEHAQAPLEARRAALRTGLSAIEGQVEAPHRTPPYCVGTCVLG
ncbi:hypothetical protein AB0N21_34525 [Streptomyces sp. NPDC051080]|uniref:hypothetical protein n=1 Tax=Streptomyces sp. NPDC051080 TaxID=3157222 RepID=UPI00341B3A33